MLNFNEHLAQSTLKLLWSLWTELGVAGIHRHHKDCLVDPEVLLLVTGFLGESDPRLQDEVRDWCNGQSSLISLQRIQGLSRTFQVEEITKTLATIEEWLGKSSRQIPDARKFSGKSKLPPLSQPSLLMLRMATIFGVGSRTVSLAALLAHLEREVSVADVTAVAGFSKTNIANTLATLHLGGLLHKMEVRNRLQYRLAHPKKLMDLIAPFPQNMTGWLFIFSFTTLWTAYAKQNTSSSTLRKAVAAVYLFKEMQPSLLAAKWEPPPLEGNPAQDLDRIESWVLKCVEKIANGTAPQLKTSFLLSPLLEPAPVGRI